MNIEKREEIVEEIIGNFEGSYSCHQGKIRSIVQEVYEQGKKDEQARIIEIIKTEERLKWERLVQPFDRGQSGIPSLDIIQKIKFNKINDQNNYSKTKR